MSETVNTIKVKPWGQGQGDFVEINESDFDASMHELLDAVQGLVEIPANWAEMHWKQVVALAKKIGADVDIGVEDAKRIIADELVKREAA